MDQSQPAPTGKLAMNESTVLERVRRFLRKPAAEKQLALRFHLRQGLSRIPYLPARIRLRVAPGEEVFFWWSSVPPYFHADRSLGEYWGEDAGELRFL